MFLPLIRGRNHCFSSSKIKKQHSRFVGFMKGRIVLLKIKKNQYINIKNNKIQIMIHLCQFQQLLT